MTGLAAKSHRLDIQALRGVAVLLVVAYHAGLPGLSAGYLGVDIFFVISGFLITGMIRDGLERGEFSFARFYYRRAKRLLPAAYAVLIVTVLAAPLVMTEIELEDLRQQVLGAITFTANFVFWQQSGYFDGTADTKPLLHFWSLAVEEQYYLLMPLFLFLVPRRAWTAAIVMILFTSLALSLYLSTSHPSAAFYLLPTRAWELAIGSIGALIHSWASGSRILSYARAPALSVILIVPFLPTGLPHPGFDALLICVATLVIILGVNGSRFECSAPVRALGRVGDISYSLYLVHWPVLVFTRAAYMGEPPVEAIWAALAMACALSVLLHRYVEEPFRRGQQIISRRFVGGMIAVSLVLVTLPAVFNAATADVRNFAEVMRRNHGLHPSCADSGRSFDGITEECRSGPDPRIFVWGDSFAMMWAQAIADAVAPSGIHIAQATLPRCTPLADTAISAARATQERRDYDIECLKFNEAVLRFVEGEESVDLVVIASPFATPVSRASLLLQHREGKLTERPLTEELSLEQATEMIRKIRAAGKEAIVLAPPPSIRFDGGACQERRQRGKIILGRFGNCEIPEQEWRSFRSRTISWLRRLEERAQVSVIWPSDFLCTNGTCRTVVEQRIIYRDAGHLTYEGSALLAERLHLADRLRLVMRSGS